MKTLLLQDSPNFPLLGEAKKSRPDMAEKRFVWETLNQAAWVVAYNGITVDNFNSQLPNTQDYLVDCYKTWKLFKRWNICDAPRRWQQMINLFER